MGKMLRTLLSKYGMLAVLLLLCVACSLATIARQQPTDRWTADALAATFKDNLRVFTLITNTLAKDKEISDRWRHFTDVADSRPLANRVSARVMCPIINS